MSLTFRSSFLEPRYKPSRTNKDRQGPLLTQNPSMWCLHPAGPCPMPAYSPNNMHTTTQLRRHTLLMSKKKGPTCVAPHMKNSWMPVTHHIPHLLPLLGTSENLI